MTPRKWLGTSSEQAARRPFGSGRRYARKRTTRWGCDWSWRVLGGGCCRVIEAPSQRQGEIDQGDEDGHFDEGSGHAGQGSGGGAVGGDGDGAPSSGVLMPSTPSAYPQVVSRCLASFRVVKSGISAVHAVLCAWFDSRQLHREDAGQSHKLWPVLIFHRHLINICGLCSSG
jgi:hypothetical protein